MSLFTESATAKKALNVKIPSSLHERKERIDEELKSINKDLKLDLTPYIEKAVEKVLDDAEKEIAKMKRKEGQSVVE